MDPLNAYILILFCFGILACTGSSNSKKIQHNNDENATRLTSAELNPGQTWEPDNYLTKDFPPAPPYIPAPQYACTEKVLITGCVEKAIVELMINGDPTNIYSAVADAKGMATVIVPPLQVHDKLVATQTVNYETSPPSTMRHVEALRENQLPTPQINRPVWECGRLVGAEGIIPGTTLILNKDGIYETDVWTTDEWKNGFWPIKTPSSLGPVNAAMTVQQAYCPKDPNNAIWSLESDPKPIQASPNQLPNFTSVKALEGTNILQIKGTYFGSTNRYYRDSFYLGKIYPKWENFNALISETIDSNLYSYSATHELCPGSAPKPMEADIVDANTVEQLLGQISIREPICPGTTAIQVESTLSSRVGISYNNTPVSSANIDIGRSMIGMPQGLLQTGGVIEVVQIAEGTSSTGNIEGAPATATVGSAFGLEMFGAESFTDQNTNQTIEGFVRNGDQRSRGPRFELSCCASCDCVGCSLSNDDQCLINGEPRTATLKMFPSNDLVTLYEDFPGHFVGRWDWFLENPNATVWPPAAPEAKALLIDSPCGQEVGIGFDIFVGEPDYQDATPPDLVKLKVQGTSVTNTSNDAIVEVLPIESSQIALSMRDPDGAKSLAIESDSFSNINTPISKSSDPNIVPIPTELSFNTTLEGPQPYEFFEIFAVGSSFSQVSNEKTETAKLTVKGKHPEPVLDDVTPTSVYSDQTISLSGGYLAYNTLDTIVRFDGPNGILETTSFNSSVDTLSNIQLPAALNSHFGEIEIWVVTRYNGPTGVIEKESNHLNITLLNRNNSFQAKSGSSFHSGSNPELSGCSSNTAQGGITDVTIETSSNNDAQVRIKSNGRSDKVVGFNVAAAGDGAPSLGGVALFSNSCRMVAIMSDTGQSTPAKFTLSLYYFSSNDSQAATKHITHNIGFHYNNNVGDQYVPSAFNIMANAGDGSVIGVGHPIYSHTGSLAVRGHIHDMLKPDGSSGVRNSPYGSCDINNNCSYIMSIDGRDATLDVNGSELLQWTLNN